MTNTPPLVLSDLTVDFNDFTSQFEQSLSAKEAWKGNLTTQTSQTLIELISAVGTFMQGRLIRAREDSFSETAQSDDSVRSITQMQGLRMSRKLPSTIEVQLTSTVDVTLSPLTPITINSQPYFCKTQLTIVAGTTVNTTLYQGQIEAFVMNGLGTPRQTFMSVEDSFKVSDQDVVVLINDVAIPKAYGGLWNYRAQPAFADLTTNDGRLLIVFGDSTFGSMPGTNDVVTVKYAVTSGGTGNNQNLMGSTISLNGLPEVTGTVVSNPTGGSDEKSITAYKNLSSGSFGTYSSAVTKNQYEATVGVYPGIIDAFTQAQRDINPTALEWMNVIRVSGLTTSTWSAQHKQDFCNYMQTVSMYAPRFVWQDAIAVPRDVELTVYCFNSAVLTKVQTACLQAIQELFAPRPGLLMTNFYPSDLIAVCMQAGAGAISYIEVKTPTVGMIVTAPASPKPTYEVLTGGILGTYAYAYGISSINAANEEGPPTNWVFPQIVSDPPASKVRLTWEPIPDAISYNVYGRKAGTIGLLGTVLATDPLEFVDLGTIVPTGGPPNAIAQVPIRYNTLANCVVNAKYAERQQRIENLPYRGSLNG